MAPRAKLVDLTSARPHIHRDDTLDILTMIENGEARGTLRLLEMEDTTKKSQNKRFDPI